MNTITKRVLLSLTLFLFLAPVMAQAATLEWNRMSNDYETFRMSNITDGTPGGWADPITAGPGDQLNFNIDAHCSWNSASDPTEDARDTFVRINYPIGYYSNYMNLVAQVDADNVPAIDDPGRINLTGESRLVMEDNATLYYLNGQRDITVQMFNGYVEVDLGDIGCDNDGDFTHLAQLKLRGHLEGQVGNPPTVDIKADGSDGPITVDYEDDVVLSWDSSDADDCDAERDWSGDKSLDGSETRHNLTNDKVYRIVCTNAHGSASDSVTVRVRDDHKTLDVNLTASPDNGDAPLRNVDLRAVVSGSADGEIEYKFDCTNDGDYEYTGDSNSGTKTVRDICDYDDEGTYTARVRVYRDGLTATDTDTIRVNEDDKNLSVNLAATPDNGDDPLRNVDLRARVTGSADGEITYKFDCENDGDWDYTGDSYSENKTVRDLCDYDEPGTYTAEVKVWRDGLTASDTDTIRVKGVAGDVTAYVDKEVRNLSDGDSTWGETTNANPGEYVQYRVEITAPKDEDLNDVEIKDSLGSWAKWHNNVEIDGEKADDQDITKGIDIGDIDEGDTVVVTFAVLLEGSDYFGFGTKTVTNTVKVYSEGDLIVDDTADVIVSRSGVAGATDVPTGILDDMVIALGVTLLLGSGLIMVYFLVDRSAGDPMPQLKAAADEARTGLSDLTYTLNPLRSEKSSMDKLQRKVNQIKRK